MTIAPVVLLPVALPGARPSALQTRVTWATILLSLIVFWSVVSLGVSVLWHSLAG